MYKAKSRHFNENLRSDPFSLKKILYHEFIKQQLKKEDEEGKESPNKNNLSEQILPIIPNKNIRQMNADENNSQKFSDNLLITSGMFKQKEYCKDPNQKLKLYNIITLNNNVNDENIIKKCYPKIENIEKINEKYKLQLDLKHLFDDNKEVKKSKTMTKKALMNYFIFLNNFPGKINSPKRTISLLYHHFSIFLLKINYFKNYLIIKIIMKYINSNLF
jgi:hypothetical protein